MGTATGLRSKKPSKRVLDAEAAAWGRWLEANWHKMLGGNIGIAVKLAKVEDDGGHWIYTPTGMVR